MNEGVCVVQVWIQCRSWNVRFHRILITEYFPSQCSISNIILFVIFEVLRDKGYKDFCTVVRCVSTQSRLKHLENTSTHHSHCHGNLTPHTVTLYGHTILCAQEKNPTPHQIWIPSVQSLTNHFIRLLLVTSSISNIQYMTLHHYSYALTSVFNRFASLNLKQFDQAGNILMQTAKCLLFRTTLLQQTNVNTMNYTFNVYLRRTLTFMRLCIVINFL